MNWTLASLAILGVVVLLFELFATYINKGRSLQANPSVVSYNFKLNFYRIGVMILLELGVYITWITKSLLVK